MTRLRENTLPTYRHPAIGSAVVAPGPTLPRLSYMPERIRNQQLPSTFRKAGCLEQRLHWQVIVRPSFEFSGGLHKVNASVIKEKLQ
jgi:hypothetical protein